MVFSPLPLSCCFAYPLKHSPVISLKTSPRIPSKSDVNFPAPYPHSISIHLAVNSVRSCLPNVRVGYVCLQVTTALKGSRAGSQPHLHTIHRASHSEHKGSVLNFIESSQWTNRATWAAFCWSQEGWLRDGHLGPSSSPGGAGGHKRPWDRTRSHQRE